MRNRCSKRIYTLVFTITILLTVLFFITNKRDELQWICQMDYTEITFADGFYYYKSEADNFYLYRTDEAGQYQQCIIRQVPKEIYVVGDWVYFTNLSEGSKLYRVKTDGSGLEMVCAEKISRFFPIGSLFYCLSQGENGDKIFVCTSDGKTKTIYEGECYWISTDGKVLYLNLESMGEHMRYWTVAINKSGEIKEEYETYMRDLIPTERYLYYSEGQEIIRLDKNTGKRTSFKIPDFIGDGQRVFRYVVWNEEIYVLFLDKKENGESYRFFQLNKSTGIFEALCEDTDLSGSMFLLDRINCLYLVNGKIFYKNYVAEGKGELWHMLELSGGGPTIFEEMEEPVTIDTSLPGDFFYNGSREGFLDQDIVYEAEREDGEGNVMGTEMILPKISKDISAADLINSKIKREAENFYEEQVIYHGNVIGEIEDGEKRTDGLLSCDYIYADENYVSIVYRRALWNSDGEYGTREYVTRLYSSSTGEELQIDDLFKVKWEEVLLRFSYLIRKTELSFNIFSGDLPLVNGNYMRVYYCLTNTGVDIVFVDDMRTFKEYHFVLSHRELEDILIYP